MIGSGNVDIVVSVDLDIDKAGGHEVVLRRIDARTHVDNQTVSEPDLVVLEDPAGRDNPAGAYPLD
ncbi:MAG: hypothetical protein ACI9MX_001373 [Candidatus Aldehydirespiratoraceae bacterium]